jgi:hypothetical protein
MESHKQRKNFSRGSLMPELELSRSWVRLDLLDDPPQAVAEMSFDI